MTRRSRNQERNQNQEENVKLKWGSWDCTDKLQSKEMWGPDREVGGKKVGRGRRTIDQYNVWSRRDQKESQRPGSDYRPGGELETRISGD